MIISGILLLVSGSLCQLGQDPVNPNPVVEKSSDSVHWLTGNRFQQEMERPFSGSWSNLEFRQLLKEVAAHRQIAIVLDRRIDPTAAHPITVNNVSLRTGLVGIAKQVGGDATVPENLVFLGPPSATKTLRTLIELRGLDLQSKEAGIPRPRRVELLRPQTFESADLDSPRMILEKFAGQSRLRIANATLVPHDLWAAMTLPEVSVIEALTVVLTQFDLTFHWINKGEAIELIPIPEVVALERKHSAKKKAAEALALIRQNVPKIPAEVTKSEILVTGLLEDHEAIAALLRGEGKTSPVKIEAPQPLKKQVFLLQAERVPISAIMKNLEESAVTFEYDAEEFKAAGIDLETRVDIDVKKATADEFFKLIFDPIGVEFRIDHLTVKLKPKRRP